MARKPTKEQLRRAKFESAFTEDELNDPEVVAIRRRLEERAAKAESPNFDDVVGSVSTQQADPGVTSLDRAGTAFRGGLADIGADLAFRDIDATAAETIRKQREDEAIRKIQETNAFGQTFGRGISDPLVELFNRDPISPLVAKAGAALGGLDSYRSLFDVLSDTAKTDRAAVQTEVEGLRASSPIRGTAERAALDVAGSPQSLASIPGGPFAAIPAMTTYNDEYRQGREAGLSPEDAAKRAENQAAVEGGISAIPAGKVGQLLTRPFRGVASRVTAPLRSSLADIVLRTTRTAVGEGLEESVQYLASQGIDKAYSVNSDDPIVANFAKRQLSQDLWADTLRAGLAGVAGGGALGSIHSSLEVARENGQLAQDALVATDKATAAREAQEVAKARDNNWALQGTADLQEARAKTPANIMTPEIRSSIEERLNNIRSRSEAADTELAQLEEDQITRVRLAEEAGLEPDTFDAVKLQRARSNKVGLQVAEQRLSERLRQDQEGRTTVAEDKAAADKAAFDALPKTDPNLAALSVGNSRRTTPKNKTKQDLAVAERAAAEADLRAFADATTTKQEATTGPKPVASARALVQNLAKNRNTADAKRALSMIAGGRIEVVNSLKDLGLDEIPGASTRGVEKDGKIYIVADNIDRSADIAPQLAATIFHETKHAADFGQGDAELPDNLAGFIGMENAEPINRKIEQAAGRGNKIAQLAQERARSSGTYEEELVPHFITAMKESRNRASGMSNVVSDIRQAVKSKYNNLLGGNNEVQLDDVYKLSEQLVDYIAQNKEFDTSPAQAQDIDGRRMIISKGTGESLALNKGRTYLSADGNRKYEIDDSKSSMNVPPDAKPGVTYKASDILKHDELYRELPQLADVKVEFFNDPKSNYGGMYEEDTNTIRLNQRVIGLNPNKFNGSLHRFMVHEMQHAAQRASGTTGGANPEMFLSPRGKQLRKQLEDLRAANAAAQALGSDFGGDNTELTQAEADYDDEYAQAEQRYRKVLGEQEAYSTESRVALTDRERQETTSDLGRTLEEGFIYRDGGVFSERGKRLDTPEYRREAVTYPKLRSSDRMEQGERVNLGKYFPSVWSEMSGDTAGKVLPKTNVYSDPRALRVWVSNKRDLAKGQGLNTGILVEFDTNGLTGSAQFTKPASRFMWDNDNSGEFVIDGGDPDSASLRDNVKAFTINKDADLSKSEQVRIDQAISALMADGWTKTTNNNGSVTYAQPTNTIRREVMTPENRVKVDDALTKFRSTIAGFASAYGKLGKEAGQIAEAATGETSYYSDLGFTTGRLIEQGVNDASSRLVSEGRFRSQQDALEYMNNTIKGRIENLNKIDTDDRRQAAIAGLVREYPELAPLQDAYNIINDNTRIIIRNMLASKTGPLTDLEIQKMNTLRNNTTRYLTTVYGLFQGKDGSKWANRLAREYAVAKGELARSGNVPDKVKEGYEIYKNALDYVIANDVAVFDPERLAKLPKEKIDLIYDTWYSDRQGFQDELRRNSDLPKSEQAGQVRQALIERIIQKGGVVNATQIENRANTIVRGLLGLNNSNNPVSQYYRGMKQDKGILMDRTNIAEPIRALFDEITDPALRVMMTISKQGELIARTKMLGELKQDLYGQKIISNEDKADDNANKFTEQLRGESWGPLEGYWVTPEIYTVIDDAREMAVNMEGALGRLVLDSNAVNNSLAVKSLRYYTRLAGLQKMAAIVWNPAQTVWNLGGSWISLIKEGNINPATILRATKSAGRLLAKEVRNAGLPTRVIENDPDVTDLIRYDVIDSAMIQEVRQMPFEYSRAAINAKNPILGNLGKGLKVTKAGVTQVFALSDLTAKIANYFKQVDVLKSYYEAEGVDISEDAIKREAANIIKDTNITFRRTAPIFKMSERLGLTYVMPYIQGVFRSSIYGYIQGVKDITRGINEAQTPKGKQIMVQQGMRRIAGTSIALFAIQALAKSVLTGDEEKDAKIRQLQFPDARYGDSVYVGDDAKGNPMMLRLSRFDPYGPLTDMVRIVGSDATKEQKNRDVMAHLHDLLIKPRLGQQLLASAYEFSTEDPTVKGKQTKLERLFPQATEMTKDFIAGLPRLDYADGEQLISLLDTMMPGATNIVDPTNVNPTGQGTSQNLEAGVRQERKRYPTPETDSVAVSRLLTAMGGRLDKIDPKMAAVDAGKDLDTARKQARERVFNRLATVNPNDRQAVVAIMDVMEDERKAFIRVKEVFEGMEALGMSRAKINEILKDQGKISEHDRHLLFSGKYDTSLEGWRTKGSSVLSNKSLQQRNKIAVDKETDEVKAAQRTESIKKAVKVLRDAGYKVKE